MTDYNYFIAARVIHILGVVFWIGGVAFVTTILIPALRKNIEGKQRLDLFELLEGRFAFQARIVTLITGFSGLYMIIELNAWERYLHPQFWWMHLMTLVWVIFTMVLFILEPLILHRLFHTQASKNPARTFAVIQVLHIFLLTLSLVAIAGAMAGAHGYTF